MHKKKYDPDLAHYAELRKYKKEEIKRIEEQLEVLKELLRSLRYNAYPEKINIPEYLTKIVERINIPWVTGWLMAFLNGLYGAHSTAQIEFVSKELGKLEMKLVHAVAYYKENIKKPYEDKHQKVRPDIKPKEGGFFSKGEDKSAFLSKQMDMEFSYQSDDSADSHHSIGSIESVDSDKSPPLSPRKYSN